MAGEIIVYVDLENNPVVVGRLWPRIHSDKDDRPGVGDLTEVFAAVGVVEVGAARASCTTRVQMLSDKRRGPSRPRFAGES